MVDVTHNDSFEELIRWLDENPCCCLVDDSCSCCITTWSAEESVESTYELGNMVELYEGFHIYEVPDGYAFAKTFCSLCGEEDYSEHALLESTKTAIDRLRSMGVEGITDCAHPSCVEELYAGE